MTSSDTVVGPPRELDDPEWLRERYVERGLSIAAVAREVGRHRNTVRRALRQHGIKLRDSGRGYYGVTHGMSGTPEWQAWLNMKRRILYPQHPLYPSYGGRGLTMEPEWIDSFEAFYAEVGPRPGPGYSLDRIDNDLGYVRGNVRWATWVEQNNNRKHGRAKLTEGQVREIRALLRAGRTGTAVAEEYGVSPPTIRSIERRRTWRHVV